MLLNGTRCECWPWLGFIWSVSQLKSDVIILLFNGPQDSAEMRSSNVLHLCPGYHLMSASTCVVRSLRSACKMTNCALF